MRTQILLAAVLASAAVWTTSGDYPVIGEDVSRRTSWDLSELVRDVDYYIDLNTGEETFIGLRCTTSAVDCSLAATPCMFVGGSSTCRYCATSTTVKFCLAATVDDECAMTSQVQCGNEFKGQCTSGGGPQGTGGSCTQGVQETQKICKWKRCGQT